ncbi:MAG: hypothetical protein Q4G27_08005 [Flavobacteriaceae bacterium]|nr:hypothetical protein [Flavobacteriaceae bacterium]
MKNVLFVLDMLLMGSFGYSQSSCFCGNPERNGCTANCGAGRMAGCEGYGGACSCNCLPVLDLTPAPKDPGTFTLRNLNIEVKECKFINPKLLANAYKIEANRINHRDYFTLLQLFRDKRLEVIN